MLYFIEYLRAIATLLVANSHFKGVYPNDALSFGGGFGVSLFFIISGYLLANINEDTRFIFWIKNKLLRLYIPLIFVRIIEITLGRLSINNIRDFIHYFIFPGTWFGGSLLVFYLLYYLVVKYFIHDETRTKQVYLIVIALFFLYTLLFIFKPSFAVFSISTMKIEEVFGVKTPYMISQFIWFICMLIGYLLRKERHNNNNIAINSILLFASIVGFLSIKTKTHGGSNNNLMYLFGFIYIVFAVSMFNLFAKGEKCFRSNHKNVISIFFRIISKCSLEIYYIQFIWLWLLKDVLFPINLALLILCIVTSALFLNKISSKISKYITTRSMHS